MILSNICLHVVEFRIDYGDELQYYICGDCLSIRCNDVTTVIMDLKTWLCSGFDKIDYKNIFNNHFNRIYKRA